VPARGAQEAADALVAAGVRAILNYAPIIVHVPPHVKIRHIDPVVALQSMAYYLENAGAGDEPDKGGRNGGGVRAERSEARMRLGRLD